MRPPCVLAALALAWAATPAAAQDAPEAPRYADGIVAVVEGEPVTRHELELRCRLRPEWHQLPRGDGPARQAFLAQELDQLVQTRVLMAAAREEKVELTPQDEDRVQATIGRIAERYRGVEGLRQLIEKVFGVPWDAFVAQQREQALCHKLLIASVSRDIFVTPDEVRRHYDAHPGEYARPGELRLRRIVVFSDPLAEGSHLSPALRALVEAGGWDSGQFLATLRERIARGEVPFEDAQRTFSQDPSYDREEVFSLRGPLELVAPLPEHIAALVPGEVSPVIDAGRYGRQLVLLLDRQAAGAVPLSEVQDQIEQALKDQVWARRQAEWIASRRAKAHVERFLPGPGN